MIETNKNYFADNREILKTIPDKSINLFLEDMPYNTTACDWEYEVDLEEYWRLRLPKLADNGVFVLTGSQPFTADLIMSNRKMFKYEIIWKKSKGSGFILAKKRPLKIHENILIFSKNSKSYFPIMRKADPKNIRKISNKEFNTYRKIDNKTVNSKHLKGLKHDLNYDINSRYPNSIIDISSRTGETNSSYVIHPTQKPVELFSYLIKTYTNENDIVFDGYSGSGTTAISCIRNNRQYIICENKKEYYDIQTKRILEEIGKTSLFSKAS